ncbi:MAG TPA: Na+/H+ antiporter NhaA [Hyphomicrobiaceae bacterium]|jgi:NhaA family Na+:H+ antiporter|nr:Na+/H+ antiporter NhaA [Hyphomicrobiaceae bacterium]
MTTPDDIRARLKGALAFIHHEAASGLILLAAAVAALLAANSIAAQLYDGFLDVPLAVQIGPLALNKPLLLWINDGLMAIFFFLVGLEIKRELLQGELSSIRQAALPAIAAAGGMAVPALIYILINAGDAVALKGWAIPSATDIAFAVGVLALVGDRVPASLKIFLLALAILDDLGAIVIIAAFYTSDLYWVALVLATAGVVVLWALNARGVTRLAPYLLTGVFIWLCVLKSGVHATLAGVVVALAIPLSARAPDQPSPLEHLEESLHPWVAFGVLPLFAFANAGVSLHGVSPVRLLDAVPLGITLGLFLGKPIGICGATWFAVRTGLAARPQDATWWQIIGVGMLGGIGFTMSLFIGMLAFTDLAHAAQLRLGVLFGSLLSAICGYLVLRLSAPAPRGSPE